MLAADERADGLESDVGREDEELDRDEFLRAPSAVWDITREPVKRQMMITLAKPSTAESRPNPTSAIDPAMTPARIATIPSTLIAPSDSHDSNRTRRASSR